MRNRTDRLFGGLPAEIWDPVLLCGTLSNGKEDGVGPVLVAGVVVGIDETHDAPIIVDLSAPERRAMHSPPHPAARHLTLPNGGEYFDGEDLSEMRPGQWTRMRPGLSIGSTRPPPPPPPPMTPKPAQRPGKRG